MSDKDYLFDAVWNTILIIVAAVTFLFLGFKYGEGKELNRMRAELIKRGIAQYNPTNALFEWKTK